MDYSLEQTTQETAQASEEGQRLGKKTVYIPKQLFDEVTKIVKKKGLWPNEAEFIREAVRHRLAQEAETRPAETG
jgi:Arc/MetJ-type ribon-helix-helix transcriptional regulator